MGLRINQNIEAFNAHRALTGVSSQLAKSMERLSSGLRVNRASDDAAGLAISERMRATVRGLAQAQRNSQDGISMVQTAEGSLQEVTNILGRIRDLAVQFNNGIYGATEKGAMQDEVVQLSAELDRIIASAEFAGFMLFDGTTGNITLQAGPNTGDEVVITGADLTAGGGVWSGEIDNFATMGVTPTDVVDIDQIQADIDAISALRGQFGGVATRLEYTINSLGAYQESLTAAESRIRDLDFAAEMTNFTRLQILQQSSIAMLGQANVQQQAVLALLS